MTSYNQADKASANTFSDLLEDTCDTCGKSLSRPAKDSVFWKHKETGTMFCYPERLAERPGHAVLRELLDLSPGAESDQHL